MPSNGSNRFGARSIVNDDSQQMFNWFATPFLLPSDYETRFTYLRFVSRSSGRDPISINLETFNLFSSFIFSRTAELENASKTKDIEK